MAPQSLPTLADDDRAPLAERHLRADRLPGHHLLIEQLKTVYDPEIPINVVDLGLVYACDAQPLADGTCWVEIKMSMTAPGCGMGDVLKEDARSRVRTVPGFGDVEVELVWDPPWDLGRMSEAGARLQCGDAGYGSTRTCAPRETACARRSARRSSPCSRTVLPTPRRATEC